MQLALLAFGIIAGIQAVGVSSLPGVLRSRPTSSATGPPRLASSCLPWGVDGGEFGATAVVSRPVGRAVRGLVWARSGERGFRGVTSSAFVGVLVMTPVVVRGCDHYRPPMPAARFLPTGLSWLLVPWPVRADRSRSDTWATPRAAGTQDLVADRRVDLRRCRRRPLRHASLGVDRGDRSGGRRCLGRTRRSELVGEPLRSTERRPTHRATKTAASRPGRHDGKASAGRPTGRQPCGGRHR